MYRFENAVDLSQGLANGMPVYPGDPEPSFVPAATLEKNGVNLTRMTLGSHTGTHVDAPMHFVQGGMTVDQIPVSRFIGEAYVADLSSKQIGSGITSKDLEAIGGKFKEDDILLCYTGTSDLWGRLEANSNFTYLEPDGADYLVSRKIRGFGIDFLSVEKFKASSPESHRTLLRNGIYIIESLNKNLKLMTGQRVLFIALPLKVQGRDGAPCRAVAVPIE
ncbi:MAG: cyclase family protein [Thaumarchaeota archaeon]|nr:cyclase family protein [Nitrososphaerota archaeon]